MIPTAQTISHLVWSAGAVDSHGNPVDTWAAPVDVDVYYYGPPTRIPNDPEPGGTQIIHDIEVGAPTFVVGSRDRFVIENRTYEVTGDPQVWDNGPFGYQPGMVVKLRKVEGGR